jgi:hypothetical protein
MKNYWNNMLLSLKCFPRKLKLVRAHHMGQMMKELIAHET